MSSIAIPTSSADRSLAAYLREIRSFPVLTREEEFTLAQRWRDHGDVAAARRLVTSHLRLVVKIAGRYRRFALPFADLVSEGNIGLMKAVRKFDPRKGCRLATYAMWWIKAEIMEFVLKSWSVVRVGSFELQKRMFYNLWKVRKQIGSYSDTDTDPDIERRLAERFGVTTGEVRYFASRLQNVDISLDQPIATYDDGEGETAVEGLQDDGPTPEDRVAHSEASSYRRRIIAEALAGLPARDRAIVEARWLSDDRPTLEALGQRFGVSRERIRQLEARSLEKVKARIIEVLDATSADEAGGTLLAA